MTVDLLKKRWSRGILCLLLAAALVASSFVFSAAQ